MSTTCICPDTPSLEGVATIPTEPLRCQCCGTPLRLTCDGECGEEHVRGAFAQSREQLRATIPVGNSNRVGKSTEPSAPSECARCHQPIERKQGRPPKCCDDCLTPAERNRREAKQVYNAAVRAKRTGVVSL